MKDKEIDFDKLRQGMKRELTWEIVEDIYVGCKYKLYMPQYQTQEEFARSLGISKSRISQLKKAYEYYLRNKNIVDLKKAHPDVAYRLSRDVDNESDLLWFMEWLEKEEKTTLEKCKCKQADKFVEMHIKGIDIFSLYK